MLLRFLVSSAGIFLLPSDYTEERSPPPIYCPFFGTEHMVLYHQKDK